MITETVSEVKLQKLTEVWLVRVRVRSDGENLLSNAKTDVFRTAGREWREMVADAEQPEKQDERTDAETLAVRETAESLWIWRKLQREIRTEERGPVTKEMAPKEDWKVTESKMKEVERFQGRITASKNTPEKITGD
jgi:hypothetical protein